MPKIVRVVQVLIALVALISISQGPLHADIAAPDTKKIDQVRSYENLLQTGDLLVVTEYTLLYDTTPSESIHEAYLGRLFEGSTELESVQPYAVTIPNSGYNTGIYSFYDATGFSTGSSYKVRLEGNPALFDNPPTIEKALDVSSPRTSAQLRADIVLFIAKIEPATDWNVDLIETTDDGSRFTASGENYFGNAIPKLRDFVPSLFAGSVDSAIFEEEVFETTYEESLKAYWDGTDFDKSLQRLADYVTIPKTVLSSTLLLGIAAAIAFYITRSTQQNVIGVFAAVVVLSVGALVGLTTYKFVATLALLGAISMSYMFFYRGSTS